MDAQNYIRCVCEGCNTEFEAVRPKRYCTRKCNKAAIRKNKTSVSRAEYVANMRENAASKFHCEFCGIEAHRRLSGTNKAKSYVNKFCSMDCRTALAKRISDEVAFLRGLTAARRRKKPAVRRLAIALEKVARIKARAEKPCPMCGVAVGYSFGRPKTFCSSSCAEKTEAAKSLKRAHKQRRIAVERGCKEARSLDPIKVFDRDGWQCQICGVRTPKKLRGSMHKHAPELDHVVAISKGGPHTWANVQCSCRSCNGAKSNGAPAGQMGLFTALM